MAMLRAREAVMQGFRPNLQANGINEQQWRVLRALAAAEGGEMAVGLLAERTLLLGPSLSRILVKLEDLGLISRRPDAGDARRTFIAISPSGIDLARSIAEHSESLYDGIERRFGRDRLAALIGELAELTAQEQAWNDSHSREGDTPR
jgi:homoprotocatechuate degradation regulator HpaR